MMAIGGAALAGCGADEDTREAAVALANTDKSNDRREIISLVFSSNSLESSEDDDARNVVSAVLNGCILLFAGRFVGDNPLLVSVAVNASPLATHVNRHANAKRFLGTGILARFGEGLSALDGAALVVLAVGFVMVHSG